MEKIGQNFMTAGYLVFWKQFPAAGYLDTYNKLKANKDTLLS